MEEFKLFLGERDTLTILKEPVNGYRYESEDMYPRYATEAEAEKEIDAAAPADLQKTMAEAEPYFADIQEITRSNRTVDEPMRTKAPVISWDEILIKGVQLAKIPLSLMDMVNRIMGGNWITGNMNRTSKRIRRSLLRGMLQSLIF